MYEYQKSHTGFGQIHSANVDIFEGGIGVNPPVSPRAYPGIVPSRANIFGRGISILPARAPSPVVGIDACATGNCPSMGLGTVGTTNERPWWHYALLGAGVGAGYLYLRRSGMLRNPSQLTDAEVVKQAAAITIQAGIPTILWGPPGIGKTKWVQGLGEAMAPMNDGKPVKVITVIGSTKDPTDIGGMPTVDGDVIAPAWARELRKRSDDGLRSILFLDEFSSMSAIVHAALLRVVNEKIAGDRSFDPKKGPLKGHAVHIVMAANRKKHGAGAVDLPPPAANRIIHFEWPAPNAVEWAEGMLFGWKSPFYFKLPEDWRKSPLKRKALEEVTTFLRYREGIKQQPILFKMPGVQETDEEHGGKKTGGAWPSPRSWDLAAQALGAAIVAGAPKNVQLKAVEGAVGVGAAFELFGFRKFEDLPDPEKVLKSPETWDVPKEEIRLFIATGAIANAVARKVTLKRFEAAWKALDHALDETEDDVATLIMAAEQLVNIKKDPRYKDVLKKWKPPMSVLKKFFPTMKASKWTSR